MASVEEFTTEVLGRLRADMQSIRHPQGDVHPAVFFGHADGLIQRRRIPPAAFDSHERKDLLVTLLAGGALWVKPDIMAIEYTVYQRIVDPHALTPQQRQAFSESRIPEGVLTPSDPRALDRVELVTVYVLPRDGHITAHQAEVHRDGKRPPTFGEWDQASYVVGGLMVEPVAKAMHCELDVIPDDLELL